MASRSITFELSEAAFAALTQRAAHDGQPPEEVAREAVEARLTDGSAQRPNLALLEAPDRLEAFGKSLPPAPPDPMIGGIPRVVRWIHEARGELDTDYLPECDSA